MKSGAMPFYREKNLCAATPRGRRCPCFCIARRTSPCLPRRAAAAGACRPRPAATPPVHRHLLPLTRHEVRPPFHLRARRRPSSSGSKFVFEMAEEHEKDKQFGDEEEEEYVLLDLDDCLYSDIQPNAPYVLSGLDTLSPTLILGDGLKMIGEYEETVGTCYLFSESDAPPKPTPDETTPSRENKDKQPSGSKEAPSKEVKHLASVQKILKFRSINVDQQQHRAYNDKEF